MREVAAWLSRFDKAGLTGWKEIERNWVSETIVEPHRSRILGLLRGDWLLVSPQSLLIAAKRAITAGHRSDLNDMRPLFMAAVSIQGGLGVDRGPEQDEAAKRLGLLTEIIRSQAFHRRPDWATRIAQSKVRWFDIPRREGLDLPLNVAESFEQVTGVSLLDFQSIGFCLFASALEHPGATPTVAAMAAGLHLGRERFDRVLDLIAAPIAGVAEGIRREEHAYGEDWTFDTLRRFPVMRLADDRVLILSPSMVIERTFGWLPFFDMTEPEGASRAIRATADQAKGPFRSICEREVVETLQANVAAGRKRGRLFDGPMLRAAYPGGEIGDAAIAYADEWLIVEVSSGQLKRDTVVGGFAEALDDDLARLIDEKVDQIEATINRIRADPARLTGGIETSRPFTPVLVIAEGVPINPLTHVTISARLTAAGRLAASDVGPLHILDTEDLYVAETVAETDRLGLNELLARHRRAGLMRRVDLRSWLMLTQPPKKVRAERLSNILDAAMDGITDNLGIDPEPIQAARVERRAASRPGR